MSLVAESPRDYDSNGNNEGADKDIGKDGHERARDGGEGAAKGGKEAGDGGKGAKAGGQGARDGGEGRANGGEGARDGSKGEDIRSSCFIMADLNSSSKSVIEPLRILVRILV